MKRGNPGGRNVKVRDKAKALIFQVLSGSHEGVAGALEVGRLEVTVAGWSVGPLTALRMRLEDVTQDDVKMAYTQRGRYKLTKPKQRQSVHLAWKAIKAAQADLVVGKKLKRQKHPDVYDAMHSSSSTLWSTAASLRAEIFARHPGLLTLGSGLEVRESVDLGCPGLFATVDIAKDQLITFYDGPAIAIDDAGIEKYCDRRGWFISTGRSSKNSAVFVGFTSTDPLSKTSGLMSLTNSDRADPNCQRYNLQSPFCVDGVFIPETIFLMAKCDISATPEHPVELTWDYCVR